MIIELAARPDSGSPVPAWLRAVRALASAEWTGLLFLALAVVTLLLLPVHAVLALEGRLHG